MANYLNTETGEYPRHSGDIQLLYPDWRVGDALPEPWVEVEETIFPELSDEEVADEIAPTKVGAKWVRTWSIRPITEYEKLRRNNPYPLTTSQFGYIWDDTTSSWVEVTL